MTDFEQNLRKLVEQVVRDVLAEHKPASNDTHLTVAEYARRWSLAESTVREAIREKRLDHDRIGRAIRIVADARIRPPHSDATERARLVLLGGGKVSR